MQRSASKPHLALECGSLMPLFCAEACFGLPARLVSNQLLFMLRLGSTQ